MRLWHRVGGVLLGRAAPAALERLASPDAQSWRHGFHLYLHHGPMSADAARNAGAARALPPSSVPPPARTTRSLAAALHAADEAS